MYQIKQFGPWDALLANINTKQPLVFEAGKTGNQMAYLLGYDVEL